MEMQNVFLLEVSFLRHAFFNIVARTPSLKTFLEFVQFLLLLVIAEIVKKEQAGMGQYHLVMLQACTNASLFCLFVGLLVSRNMKKR